MKYILKIYLITFLIIISFTGIKLCNENSSLIPSLEPPKWPIWVHKHWVWENSGTQESAYNLVTDYLERDIPVGAIIIDRPWETECNTFIPDPNLYPDLKLYIDKFHALNVKVFMWITSVVNVGASNFKEGLENGYFLSNGATIKWWGGEGALLDYTNPEAVNWWHLQMDKILEMNIDGWKCDATDPYVMTMVPPATGYTGHVTWEEYKNLYYRDFFEYTRAKLGKDRVITARPCDDWVGLGIPITFAPVDVNFAGWVGDQDANWSGIRTALNNMFASANQGYVSFGSDIGGFRGDDTPDREVFIRWAQLGAFSPIMENGGGGEHRPWKIDDEILKIYRKFTYLHHQLIPYIYSQGALSYENNLSTIRPQKGEFIYTLGDSILIAPYYNEKKEREIFFPEGEWIYFFDERKIYNSGFKQLEFPLEEFPVFIKKGSIIPLWIENDVMPYGSEKFKDYTTLFIYPKDGIKKSFGLYEEDKIGTLFTYSYSSKKLQFESTPTQRSLILRIYGINDEPKLVKFSTNQVIPKVETKEELFLKDYSWYQEDSNTTWILIKSVENGVNIEVSF